MRAYVYNEDYEIVRVIEGESNAEIERLADVGNDEGLTYTGDWEIGDTLPTWPNGELR